MGWRWPKKASLGTDFQTVCRRIVTNKIKGGLEVHSRLCCQHRQGGPGTCGDLEKAQGGWRTRREREANRKGGQGQIMWGL